MTSFDRSIPPGGEGKIAISMNTRGFQRDVRDTAVVYTNDPQMSRFTLGIRVFVQVPIYVNPRYIRIYGREDTAVTQTADIRAELDKPLTLEPGPYNLEGKVAYEIKEIEAGRKFRVYFTNLPGVSGSWRGFLTLKTNYEEAPLITIRIAANVRKVPQPEPREKQN